MPAYPNANLWSNTHQIQIATITAVATEIETTTGERVTTYQLVNQTIVTDANLQQQLLSRYKRNPKNKSQEYAEFLRDKKSLMTILFGQCNEATQTEIAPGDNYTDDRDEGKLLAFIQRLRAICFGGDDGGLTFPPYNEEKTPPAPKPRSKSQKSSHNNLIMPPHTKIEINMILTK